MVILDVDISSAHKTLGIRPNPSSVVVGDVRYAFVFGTEAGKAVKTFKRMWRELFQLAGLDYGRAKGLTWHTPSGTNVSLGTSKTPAIRLWT